MTVSVPTTLALGTIADGSLMIASDERNNFTAVQVGVNGLIAMFTNAPTKGDLIVSAGAGAFDKLGVGSNGQAIVADSTQPLGVKWAAVGGSSQPSVQVKNSIAQTITTATWTSIACDTESWDTDTMHDTVTNNSRLTCFTAGKYLVHATGPWDSADAATSYRRMLRIFKNGATGVADSSAGPMPDNADGLYMTVSAVLSLVATDYVELQVWHNKGSNATFDANFSLFSAIRLSA